MRINVIEAYREEFEVFISKYQKLCNRIFDLVVKTVPINKLFAYCRRKHPDVAPWLTGAVLSRDIVKGIVNKCNITNITPLEDFIQHHRITGGTGLIRDYQDSLDEYLSKLRTRYLLGPYKDIVNADTIIFILDWIPDDTSFLHIKRLLYEAFHHLNKRIIVHATGKKNFHLLNIFHNYTATTVPLLHVSCYGYFIISSLSHTHNRVSTSLLLDVV